MSFSSKSLDALKKIRPIDASIGCAILAGAAYNFHKQSIKEAEMDGKLAAMAEIESRMAEIRSKHAEDLANVRKAEIADMESILTDKIDNLKETLELAKDPSKGDGAKS